MLLAAAQTLAALPLLLLLLPLLLLLFPLLLLSVREAAPAPLLLSAGVVK
jgi:hypothetical protein